MQLMQEYMSMDVVMGSQGMRRCNAERWRHNKDKTSDAERKSQGYGYRTTGVEPVFERYMKENKK